VILFLRPYAWKPGFRTDGTILYIIYELCVVYCVDFYRSAVKNKCSLRKHLTCRSGGNIITRAAHKRVQFYTQALQRQFAGKYKCVILYIREKVRLLILISFHLYFSFINRRKADTGSSKASKSREKSVLGRTSFKHSHRHCWTC
jgi:hypothetical protein